MEFVQKAMETFSSGGGGSGRQTEFVEERTTEYYSGPAQSAAADGGPPLPRPWVARWAEQDRRWYYLNEETGQTLWERPGAGYQGGYEGQRGYAGGTEYYQEERYQEAPKKDHSLAYGAAGAAAGLVGGALLMHEGEKIHDEWDGEKERVEERVEDFPENAAAWTGEKVGEAEYGVNRFEQGVENFPENAAEWVGDKVGGVERFGDEVDYAYDEGRAEGRAGW
ncbi:WW domain protein [Talaromyces proteolyticus]|uniref:WW domain protein n=1 Tax=Talaromyces proteolyticus TaxID=1131652 RepID=A0AAD4KYM9_9EURO|nr:WW domain protein [Talaromyces proteolyticus]KAH8702213.1 WW domain protein [Talaromyces proteolyticus]